MQTSQRARRHCSDCCAGPFATCGKTHPRHGHGWVRRAAMSRREMLAAGGQPQRKQLPQALQPACADRTTACAGNARWSPSVSEYRQAALAHPLQYAAQELLTTEPPALTSELLDATTQLASTGRCEPCLCFVRQLQTTGCRLHLLVMAPCLPRPPTPGAMRASCRRSDRLRPHDSKDASP